MDDLDISLLRRLQQQADLPLSDLARKVGLSKSACWNRLRRLEEMGVIAKRITLLDRKKLGLPIVVFLSISVQKHNDSWTQNFHKLVQSMPEIIEVHRLTGAGADYLLKVVAPSVEAYDQFQQKLIRQIDFSSMSSQVSLQELKCTNEYPFAQLNQAEPNPEQKSLG